MGQSGKLTRKQEARLRARKIVTVGGKRIVVEGAVEDADCRANLRIVMTCAEEGRTAEQQNSGAAEKRKSRTAEQRISRAADQNICCSAALPSAALPVLPSAVLLRLSAAPDGIVLEETMDVTDRAHNLKDHNGLLYGAAKLNGHARARRYPRVYMVGVGGVGGRRVSFESALDETAERLKRLAALGLEVHGIRSISAAAEMAARKLGGKMGGRKLRSIVEQRTTQEAMTREDCGKRGKA